VAEPAAPGRVRVGPDASASARSLEARCRDGFEEFAPGTGADWVDSVLARRARGEVTTGLWEDDGGVPRGWVAWEKVPSVGRRVVLAYLTEPHRSAEGLADLLRAFEAAEPLAGPTFYVPDAIPGVSPEAQEEVLTTMGMVHFDRERVLFPHTQGVPAAMVHGTWRFRAPTPADAVDLLRLTCRAYRDYPGQLEWAHVDLVRDLILYADSLREHPESVVPEAGWVVSVGGGIRGSVVARRGANGRRYIDSLQVDPSWHGRGLGRALMVRALSALREHRPEEDVRLNYLRQNERAAALYRSLGFEPDPEPLPLRRGYWLRRRTLGAVLARPGNEKFR
jgi:ribosomal protein S18 acetylase RimI-like enzyme